MTHSDRTTIGRNLAQSVLGYAQAPGDEGATPAAREDHMNDRQAAKAFRLRREEVRVGARALVRRLKDLEARGRRIRGEMDDLCANLLPACPLTDAQLDLLDEVEALDEDTRACRWQQYALTADAIGTDYTAADIASWCDRAQEMTARRPQLDWQLLDDLLEIRKVPNLPFRERLEDVIEKGYPVASAVALVHRHLRDVERETGVNAGSVSLLCDGRPQPRILKRWLGMETQPNPKWGPSLRLFVSYEQALALQRALDLSPHQAGV